MERKQEQTFEGSKQGRSRNKAVGRLAQIIARRLLKRALKIQATVELVLAWPHGPHAAKAIPAW